MGAPATAADTNSQRYVQDTPPIWNGAEPERELEPYLKLLEGWLTTTRVAKAQQGMMILQYAQGDLKLLINELTVQELTQESAGHDILDK